MSKARAEVIEVGDPSYEATIVNGIPAMWAWSTIGDFCTYIQRGKSPKYAKQSDLPVINQKCVRWDELQIEHVKFIHPDQWDKWSETRFVVPGDVLWNSTGTGTIGRAYHVSNPPPLKHCVVDSHITILRSNPEFESRYLYYFIRSPLIQQKIDDMQTGSTNQVELGRKVIFETRIPIAPLAEQKRIVSKIDELFSDIEAGERALKRARAALARYRKSVLKAAVTGDLTADWRAANRERLEPADKLLTRILAARREAWEKAELAKLKAQGKFLKSEEWKQRYKEPNSISVARAEEVAVPDGWASATIDQLSTHITSGSRDWKQYYDKGNGVFILAQNVRPLKLDLSNVQNVDPPHDDRDAVRSIVFQNDILITIVGANTGDVCRVPTELDRHFVCQSVALIRPSTSRYARFLELFLNAEGGGKSQIAKHIYGAGRPHLSFDQIRELLINLPPITELAEIESRVDEIFSDIDAVDKTIDEQERAARALKQSILKAAFEGRLVPQDPADEPAANLLERIKKARK